MSKKTKKYTEISEKLLKYIGGKENVQGVAHCATRLRIVFGDASKISMKDIEELELAKGAFIVGDQLQVIFGAGTVNDIYAIFSKVADKENMSLSDVKSEASKNQNPLQKGIKSLSDIFIAIIPGLLAAALLMGVTGLLSQQGVLGEKSIIEMYPSLAGVTRFLQITSTGIFTVLPLLVAYSATKRYGGNPVLGIVIGAIMLHPDLANAYGVGNGTLQPEVINVFGLKVSLVGFQGGIIIALIMGFIVAKLDVFFNKTVPDLIKLFLSPLLTVTISSFLLFVLIGPLGRELANVITGTLISITTNFGVIGYMLFAGVQQIIVITGLHHVIGAVEAQLVSDTGNNFLMPLMSVALIGQGGAVLGHLFINFKSAKEKQICISSFASILFGISEPAIFGVTLKHKTPLIAGCLASAVAGAFIYFTKVTAIGFGATAVPGLAIVSAENSGHLNYILAHLIALVLGIVLTILFSKIKKSSN